MSRKSKYWQNLVVEVASGASVCDAAVKVGCAESTAYRICRTAKFKNEVGQIRTDATHQAVGALSRLAVDAVKVLKEIMEDPNQPPAPRVTAASKVLALLAPLSELHELRERLDALETTNELKVVG